MLKIIIILIVCYNIFPQSKYYRTVMYRIFSEEINSILSDDPLITDSINFFTNEESFTKELKQKTLLFKDSLTYFDKKLIIILELLMDTNCRKGVQVI